MLKVSDKWQDYVCIDAGNEEKLESWNGIILRRPDPQAIWKVDKKGKPWLEVDGHYHRSNSGGGSWEWKKEISKNS